MAYLNSNTTPNYTADTVIRIPFQALPCFTESTTDSLSQKNWTNLPYACYSLRGLVVEYLEYSLDETGCGDGGVGGRP